jgi:hypothetical protein
MAVRVPGRVPEKRPAELFDGGPGLDDAHPENGGKEKKDEKAAQTKGQMEEALGAENLGVGGPAEIF